MELTKEHFDEAISRLATKDDLQSSEEEMLFRITDAMATIEEGLEPEERITLIEQKLDTVEKILHAQL